MVVEKTYLAEKGLQLEIKNGVESLLAGRVVKSVQRGSFALSNSTTTSNITISSVDISKSIVLCSVSINSEKVSATAAIDLLNSTTLRVQRFAQTDATFCYWQVIEFY